ncbi:hypothetical protein GOP47_0011705 [Adiantum capillus-veneris]|uniref:Uncharacterized protein n=1 Tax=Adiantum capillus-veneris TaxID=13818 RepID=A0A9D4UUN6_ADICA|nr:hypothetical protein GOP47_0011705 [Adiantum capillus-veneris]
MDECFAILDAHGKFEVHTTTSHDDDLLLPMFVTVQAMCLAKRARVDSPPPAATPVLLDPKGKSSVDLYLHPDADEEDRRQEDVLEVDA